MLATVVGAAALTATLAAPAGSQESDVLTINPTEGSPGDLVAAVVDPAVVAEQCVTSADEFQDLAVGYFTDPLVPVLTEYFNSRGWNVSGPPDITTNPDVWTFNALFNIVNAIAGSTTLAQDTWAQSFVLTFAEITTQEPVGEVSSFDPVTGIGNVTVPEVAPGTWAVAASCLAWNFELDLDTMVEIIDAGVAFLEENATQPYPGNPVSPEFGALAEALGPEVLAAGILTPGELWVQTFCVDCDPLPSDNDLAAFCGVLPQIQGVPDRLATLFSGVAIDDSATYPSIDELEALVNDVKALVDEGDTTVPDVVRPQWLIATEDLRDLIFGLTAVGFDFQTIVDFAPDQAERLIEQGSGGGEPDPEFDAAIEVLTAFFVDNCIAPGGPGGEAGPATPTVAVARFTG